MDTDTLMFHYEEAEFMRRLGWIVVPPEEQGRPTGLCAGADDEGCPVRTPFLRCRFCEKTRRLRERAA